MNKEEIVNRCKELQGTYREVYSKGLIAVSDTDVQVNREWFNIISEDIAMTARHNGTYIHVECVVDGVTFVTLI